MWLSLVLLLANSCRGGGWARPRSIVDARAMLAGQRGPDKAQTGTAVYRNILSRTWGSHCRMLPTDSVYFDRKVARCGGVPGVIAGISRLLLEVEASPAILEPVASSSQIWWLNSAAGATCWP